MATSNQERIGALLGGLGKGLQPIVEREFSHAYGPEWVDLVQAEKGADIGREPNLTDPQFLLNAIWFHWDKTLGRTLGPAERNYVAELRTIRNRWAHPDARSPFSTEDVYRAYDTAERLLAAVSAPDAQLVRNAKMGILRASFEAAAKKEAEKTVVATTMGVPAAGLRPWREIALPRKDVAEGRYLQAEFAADLAQVAAGEGSSEYVNPAEFFARTYITEGLRLLLVGSLKRLSGGAGEPVVDLQTNFGGGKTHSLLALYHLASGVDPRILPGLEPILDAAGVAKLPAVHRAVLVGTALSPGMARRHNGLEVGTLWGELAWQLGGAEGYAMVREADERRVSPGSDALLAVLRRFGPCLILIDEWVTFARQLWTNDTLPAGTFDANLSFAQALTAAVAQSPNSLLVVSLPSSQIEIGGEGGRHALDSLEKTVQRQESPWRPAQKEESFEIVRRRLFESLADDEAHRARDAVIQHFADLYARHSGDFPSDAKEAAYQRRMTASYPLHPELFDRLFDDWSTLEKFQRTRGVLKLMAAVIHALWIGEDKNLLIMPGSLPLDDSAVLPQLTQYLEANWAPIVEVDVDGASSVPLALDRENAATLGRYSAARRVARTVFLGSAPTFDAANRGLDDLHIKLGCVQPGEQPATFGDALRRLSDRATYLYDNRNRYWFSTQPSVAKLARDRADAWKPDHVSEEIERRLRVDTADRQPFARVHTCPRNGADVPDEDEAGLVVLRPERPHSTKTRESLAREEAAAILESRGAGARKYRNALVFLAADATRLGSLEESIRSFLAWDSIWTEREPLNLDALGADQAKKRRDEANETVAVRIPETYCLVLVPDQKDPLGPVEWTDIRLTGTGALALRAAKKLIGDGHLLVKMGGVTLRYELDRVPLWEGDHIGLKQLWEFFATYLYLPRLRDSSVLTAAVEDGVASLLWRRETFGYAARKEPPVAEGGPAHYVGLVGGRQTTAFLDASCVIVKPEVAAAQIDAEAAAEAAGVGGPPGGGGGGGYPPGVSHEGGSPVSEAAPVLRRFHGSIQLDPTRPSPQFSQVADEVISRLAGLTDVKVTVEVEIRAEHTGSGFTDATVRTVTENSRTLKFTDAGFEDE